MKDFLRRLTRRDEASIHGQDTIQDEPLLLDGADKFVPTYDPSFYSDVSAIDEENRQIEALIPEVKRTAELAPSVYVTQKDRERALGVEAKFWESIRITDSFDNEISKFDSPDSQGTARDLFLLHSLVAGGMAVSSEQLTKQQQFATKHGFLPSLQPYIELLGYVSHGEHKIKLDGISLEDITSPRRKADLTDADFLQFIMNNSLIRARGMHRSYLEENQSGIFGRFPNLTLNKIERLSAQVHGLTQIPTRNYSETVSGLKGIEKDVYEKTREMSESIQRQRKTVVGNLLNPHAKDFPPLKEVVAKYLADDPKIRVALLFFLSDVNQDLDIHRIYRKSVNQADEDTEHADFYASLANAVREFIEAVPYPLPIITKDELPTIFTSGVESLNPQPVPTLTELGTHISTIGSRSSQSDYDVIPENIDWNNITPPSAVRIHLELGNKAAITLSYQSEYDEALQFVVRLQASKQRSSFDWDLLEDIDDSPEIDEFYQEILRASSSILQDVESQAQGAYDAKHPRTNINEVRQPKRAKVVYVASPTPQIERKKKKRNRRVSDESEFPIQPNDFETETIKKSIFFPTNEDESIDLSLERELANKQDGNISSSVIQQARDAILEFNASGGQAGRFKRLVPKIDHSKGGASRYTLRVGKDYRIVLEEEEESESKLRKFSILGLGQRSSIYRKNENLLKKRP